MKLSSIFLVSGLVLPSCTTTSSTAGEIEGVIVMVGSAPNARPVVEPNGPKTQLEICPGSEQDYLRQFGGIIVNGSGEWGEHPVTKERCFNLKSFVVSQLIKGRPAHIGTLQKEQDGQVVLMTEDQKKMTLERPSKGVLELVGKKVVFDLVASPKVASGGNGEQLWKVVSYMEFPQR
jgi:hypothetical protein